MYSHFWFRFPIFTTIVGSYHRCRHWLQFKLKDTKLERTSRRASEDSSDSYKRIEGRRKKGGMWIRELKAKFLLDSCSSWRSVDEEQCVHESCDKRNIVVQAIQYRHPAKTVVLEQFNSRLHESSEHGLVHGIPCCEFDLFLRIDVEETHFDAMLEERHFQIEGIRVTREEATLPVLAQVRFAVPTRVRWENQLEFHRGIRQGIRSRRNDTCHVRAIERQAMHWILSLVNHLEESPRYLLVQSLQFRLQSESTHPTIPLTRAHHESLPLSTQ